MSGIVRVVLRSRTCGACRGEVGGRSSGRAEEYLRIGIMGFGVGVGDVGGVVGRGRKGEVLMVWGVGFGEGL